ncbi:major facilitator superfamily domain-containing protein [Lipomyces japonicus]|uniref:major facilitator superfamily domain-containing protein n=1 Tax=Lipomyces japonicus TaxID=56871 RepID=UPI0034CFD0D1
MPFGILEPKGVSRVPGTVHLFENDEITAGHDHQDLSNLKRDGDIILVPQPSDSPNDPLNWPTHKKDFILFIICIGSTMAATLTPILSSSTLVLVLYFGEGFTRIALLTGWHLLGAAGASVIVAAVSAKYGKRFLYVAGIALVVGSSSWAGAATSYRSLAGARALQGIALAPFEAMVNASVGDMYFVHQRGIRLALANLSLFGTTFLCPIVAGKITASLGWHWMFWFIAIFAAVAFVLVVFFVPEHVYNREKSFETDVYGEGNNNSNENDEKVKESLTATTNTAAAAAATISGSAAAELKQSYLHSLSLFSGSKTSRPLWKIALRPFALFLHPAVIWGCLVQGALIGWTVMIGVVLAAIFMGPPLWYNEVKTGYMYTGAVIGSVIGFVLAGVLSDFAAKYLSRKNNNVYEPEFRILLVIPQAITGVAGIWGFGITASNMYKYSRYLPPFFFGLEACGMILGAVASASYITDAHRDIQVDAFISLLLFKNLYSFALTDKAYSWLLRTGVKNCFIIVGSVQIVISVLTLLFWFVGKRNRALMHKYDILEILHLN